MFECCGCACQGESRVLDESDVPSPLSGGNAGHTVTRRVPGDCRGGAFLTAALSTSGGFAQQGFAQQGFAQQGVSRSSSRGRSRSEDPGTCGPRLRRPDARSLLLSVSGMCRAVQGLTGHVSGDPTASAERRILHPFVVVFCARLTLPGAIEPTKCFIGCNTTGKLSKA